MSLDEPTKKIKPVSDEVFQFLGELAQASRRVGDTGAQAMSWFLRFAQRDLSMLSSGDWSNLQFELTAFHRGLVLNPEQALAYTKGQYEFLLSVYDHDLQKNSKDALITRQEVMVFQTLAKQLVDAILEKRPFELQLSSLKRVLWFRTSHTTTYLVGQTFEKRPGWVLRTIAEKPMDALRYRIFDLLKDHADAVRRCPEHENAGCKAIFLAERRNQEFCSVNCQSRAATRRYRIDHGLISGRPRGRPRKMQPPKTARQWQKRSGSHGKTKR